MNKKGMTMVEMIVSIVLISIVLVLLMNLFINVRSIYNRSKIQSDYEIIRSTIIDAVSSDIEKYGLKNVEYVPSTTDSVIFTFNAYRPTLLSEQIVKVLKVYQKSGSDRFYISYSYDSEISKNLTSTERITSETRILPEDAYLNESSRISIETKELNTSNTLVKVKIPLSNKNGNIYDINIVGMIK